MRRYCAINALGRRSTSAAMVERPSYPIGRPSRQGAASDAPTLLRYVVDQQVLAEAVGPRVQRAALVDARHALDERPETRAVVEHEGVDGDAAAGATLHPCGALPGWTPADPPASSR